MSSRRRSGLRIEQHPQASERAGLEEEHLGAEPSTIGGCWRALSRMDPPGPASAVYSSAMPRSRPPTPSSALAAADDDGRDVFEHIPTEWTEIRTWARHLLPPAKPSTSSPDTPASPSRSRS
ncbi:hypothetical protein [Streptomyces platensis]|uniref:hypothetical protein n=1 Tax=Streptomyces platensis TaxID=58346 RepID=UPI002E268B68